MKRTEAIKHIKATVRANSALLTQWKEGEISYGRMAEELAKSIMYTVDNDLKMLPPFVRHQYNSTSTGSENTFLETSSVTYTNSWEPEDD